MRSVLAVGQRRDESSLLQSGGYGRENSQDAHHAVVATVQQTSQEDAEDKVQHLLQAVAEPAPEQALGGFFFQTALTHINEE